MNTRRTARVCHDVMTLGIVDRVSGSALPAPALGRGLQVMHPTPPSLSPFLHLSLNFTLLLISKCTYGIVALS